MNTKIGVILAGGRGERLDAQNTLKPMVRIGNKELIFWNIEQMLEAGIENIHVVLGYEGGTLKKQISHSNSYPIEINFIDNVNWQDGMLSSILSAGHAVKGQALFLCPCDVFFEDNPYRYFSDDEINYSGIISLVHAIENSDDASGATSKIIINDDGTISCARPAQTQNGIQTGIYHLGTAAFDWLQQVVDQDPSIKNLAHVLEILSIKQALKIKYFKNQNWFDVNTPIIRIRTEMFLRKQPLNRQKKIETLNYLPKLDVFSNFVTQKEAATDIYVRKNAVSQIDSYEFIPNSHATSPHFLITDENVDKLYGEIVYQKLKNLGYNIKKIVLSAGETSKTLANYSSLAEHILVEGIDEKSILISLGGGTINNVTGFLASTLYRGIHLIHIPTTLMAQCDAAIGIKQAVNGNKGKNLIGSYFEPLKIIVDPAVLITSEERWLRDGLAESIKHAICQDKNFYDYLLNYTGTIKDLDFLEMVVRETIRLKIMLMQDDPKEKAKALVLQYGHTAGHAIEYLSGYKLGHGESIAIGMMAAAQISRVLNIAADDLVEAHSAILEKFCLPTVIDAQIKTADIIAAMRYCKRYLYGDVQFVLLEKIGKLWNYNNDYSIPCDNNILIKAINKCYES